jgi:ribose 5-phosphate isomerase A
VSHADDNPGHWTLVSDEVDPVAMALLAERALAEVRDGAVVGLGSGRAASAFVRALGERVRAGLRARGVPTSHDTATLAREVGVPLVGLEVGTLDVTVDGADEVDPACDLIKGFGGALLYERIVAAASRRQIILVEANKLVPTLGHHGRLPVEIVPFAQPLCQDRLAALGLRPALRVVDGRTFVTDAGHVLLDCGTGPIADKAALDASVRAIPGVLDHGLFLGTASMVLVADEGRIRELGPHVRATR